MTTDNDTEAKKPLKLGSRGKLELKKTLDGGSVKQSFSHGRSKTVAVEVKKKRSYATATRTAEVAEAPKSSVAATSAPTPASVEEEKLRHLTEQERQARQNALRHAKREEEKRSNEIEEARREAEKANLERLEAERKRAAEEQQQQPQLKQTAEPEVTSSPARTEQRPRPTMTTGAPVRHSGTGQRQEWDRSSSRHSGTGQRQEWDRSSSRPSGAGQRQEWDRSSSRPSGTGQRQEWDRSSSRPSGTGQRQEWDRSSSRPSGTGPRPQGARPMGTGPRPMGGNRPAGGPSRPGGMGRANLSTPAPLPVVGPRKVDYRKREEEEAQKRKAPAKASVKAPANRFDEPRWQGRASAQRLLEDGEGERQRSLAAVKRAREKEKRAMQQAGGDQQKISRDVILPEVISVQELANRMAERGADVIKSLMKMGVMATINQTIDADTAELIIGEFGHRVKRVSESDVEIGLEGEVDDPSLMIARPPVVTVMGHVDHGKTSLLDALRKTDVVAGEAGGITQHIGAYQVTRPSGKKITFIDTPGHAAFSEMRARGANVTDIVVLVVAADDGIKQQTVEAITHAKAAKVPIIVAINKMDKPGADANRVRNELLNHEIVAEELGGDTLTVEVSAKTKMGLEKLEESLLLQAEILDLKANPQRAALGTVVEAKLERGRGAVATLLVQRGTLKQGDVFVAGSEWGKVRALIDDHGRQVEEAGPAMPVEVLGLQATPLAGEGFAVVESESRARQISEFRKAKERQRQAAASGRGSLEQMMSKIAGGEAKELPIVIKGDVQGSVEAIVSSLKQLATSEVAVKVLHSAVGGINESDVTLARASGGMIIGFNVRANPQARDLAKRDHVDIRYYSIIYNVVDDVKAALSGMLAPDLREKFLGNAEIREVFNITKVGKVAGCMITEGSVKRGAKVRLLRDNVVIHEGALKTLKRFKDEVKEVQTGFECGMAFENYDNIQKGDIIECFEIETITRELA